MQTEGTAYSLQETDPIHRSLARMRTGDTLKLQPGQDGQVRVLDDTGIEVARLSRTAAKAWQRAQMRGVGEVRVLAIVLRRKEDCKPGFRERIVGTRPGNCPILEVRHRRIDATTQRVRCGKPALPDGASEPVRTGAPSR